MMRRYSRVRKSSATPCSDACLPWWPPLSMRTAAHGVTINAIRSEKIIAAEAPTGIGRMYGPIRPPTKAMGRIAAITANVARIVGLPTSSTAWIAVFMMPSSWDSGMRR